MTGKYLRIKIKESGWDLAKVAEKMNITPQHLQSKLKSNDIRADFLIEVANIINKNVYDLLPAKEKTGSKTAPTPHANSKKDPVFDQKKQIAPQPHEGFVRDFVRNPSGNEGNSNIMLSKEALEMNMLKKLYQAEKELSEARKMNIELQEKLLKEKESRLKELEAFKSATEERSNEKNRGKSA